MIATNMLASSSSTLRSLRNRMTSGVVAQRTAAVSPKATIAVPRKSTSADIA
ncbi:hypothetical protein ACVWXN_006532 [Bradyrhizobium sp. i1.4.4]